MALNEQKHPELLQVLTELGGYYECPKDKTGKRLGPLVGYAGRDASGRQFVGDVYANCAVLEEHPADLRPLVAQLATSLLLSTTKPRQEIDAFCGAPEGGKAIALFLAEDMRKRYVFPEKEVTAMKTDSSREESRMIWGRHRVRSGDRVVIVEDVMNNFSTTDKLIRLIEESGGTVAMITGLLNRSPTIGDTFIPRDHLSIRVFPLLQKPIREYRQDDPEVAEDVAKGNVVLKPKGTPANWQRLMDAMKNAR